MPRCCRIKPSQKQKYNQGMKTTEIVRHPILPVSNDNIFGKFSIKLYLEWQNFSRPKMDFNILSDRTSDNGKHNTTKCYQRNGTTIEGHFFENKENHRHQNSNL